MLKICKVEKEIPDQYKNFKNCLECPFYNLWGEFKDCYIDPIEFLEILF